MAKKDKTRPADVAHPKPPIKNASRERMKAELALLYRELAMLEAAKHYLTERKLNRVSSEVALSHVVSRRCLDVRGEYEKRLTAERKNKLLRRMVAKRLQSIKHMMSALRVDESWYFLDQQPSLSRVLNDANGFRFSVLERDVDRFITQVDSVTQFKSDAKEHPQTFATALVSRRVDGQELLVLEGRETKLIPYDLDEYTSAMWRTINDWSGSDYRKVFVHALTADAIMVRLFFAHTVRGETVGLTSSLVIKRAVENGRAVIVWRAVTSMDGHDQDGDEYVEESGWTVMQRAMDHDGKESVVSKSCTQWTPRSFSKYGDDALAIHPQASELTNLVLAATVGDIAEINEIMENRLIDDCMAD